MNSFITEITVEMKGPIGTGCLALAIFIGSKWLTWWPVRQHGTRQRAWGYLLAWPGMDARAFLTGQSLPPRPKAWILAAVKSLFGTILVWGIAPLALAKPVVAGWLGVAGLLLLLHFGLFHFVALIWQSKGVPARPIMNAPMLARSLSDFWGRRWNLAFRQLSHDYVFRPLAGRFGPRIAIIAAFAASGLVHDLVISVPAGAGYGFPTLYFLLQGMGVLLEHSGIGRGRLFAAVIILGPVPLLFHVPFLTRVVVPFLEAL